MRKTGSLELKPKITAYCKVEGCGLELVPPYGRGMCSLHYKRFMKHGDVHYERPLIVGVAECSIDGCAVVIRAKGLCATHYSRLRRQGDPLHRMRGEVVNGKRICAGCEIDKPLSEWGERKAPGGYCFDCAAAKRRDRWAAGLVDVEKNWQWQATRRARKREQFVESFTRLEIYDRDGWMCGICGEDIPRGAARPSPLSASVDHIIPISKGGAHSRANAQASHFRCDLQKGNRITA